MSDKKVSQLDKVSDVFGPLGSVFLGLDLICALPGDVEEPYLPGAMYSFSGLEFGEIIPVYARPILVRAAITIDSLSDSSYSLLGSSLQMQQRNIPFQIKKQDDTDLSEGWTSMNLNGTVRVDRDRINSLNPIKVNGLLVPVSINGGTLNEGIRSRMQCENSTTDTGDEFGAGVFSFSIPISYYIPTGLSANKIDLTASFELANGGFIL